MAPALNATHPAHTRWCKPSAPINLERPKTTSLSLWAKELSCSTWSWYSLKLSSYGNFELLPNNGMIEWMLARFKQFKPCKRSVQGIYYIIHILYMSNLINLLDIYYFWLLPRIPSWFCTDTWSHGSSTCCILRSLLLILFFAFIRLHRWWTLEAAFKSSLPSNPGHPRATLHVKMPIELLNLKQFTQCQKSPQLFTSPSQHLSV